MMLDEMISVRNARNAENTPLHCLMTEQTQYFMGRIIKGMLEPDK